MLEKFLVTIVVVALYFFQIGIGAKAEFEVELPYGTVIGEASESGWTNQDFISFNEIQYGQAVNFKAPEPIEKFDKSKPGHSCPSLFDKYEDSSYDPNNCLYLSVHTKSLEENQTVMVYISGYDIFNDESSIKEASPEYILEEDVVLVIVQHRVGPFGFLSNLSTDIPGNAGLLDIILALKWIQKHISSFGGDPTRVTLFGQHHSAALIHVLTMSPLTAEVNLFHQVIYQSGSALLDDITIEDPEAMSKEIVDHLNCETKDPELCLTKATPHDLVEACQAYKDTHGSIPFLTVGGPSGVIPFPPRDLVEKSEARAYPSMGGVVKHPGVYYLENIGKKVNTGLADFTTDLGKMLGKLYGGAKTENQRNYIKDMFPKKIFANMIIKSLLPSLVDFKGTDVKYSTSEALKYNVEKGGVSYLYAFNYHGEHNFLDTHEIPHVSIMDENLYLFLHPIKREVLNPKDTKMAKFMIKLWTSFAKTGKPEAHSLHEWPAMIANVLGPYLRIDTIHEIGYDFSEEFFIALKDQQRGIDLINF